MNTRRWTPAAKAQNVFVSGVRQPYAAPRLTRRAARRWRRLTACATAVGLTIALSGCGGNPQNTNGTITGEGATSQQNAINAFADILIRDHGINLAYNATGSGAGVQKFIEKRVVFGGSDSPLDAEEARTAARRCDGHPAWHLPLVVGPVAIAYNVPGVDDLILNSRVLAGIFSGRITSWDDARLRALNPGVALPHHHINVIFRADKSGTTDNVQKFLAITAPEVWPAGNTGKVWQGVGNGAQGSAGVASDVMGNPYAITYVEGGYTQNLHHARLDFGSGPVRMSEASAGRALDRVRFRNPDSLDRVVDVEALYQLSAPGTYPFLLTTYEIFCSAGGYSPRTRQRLVTFLTSALTDGQQLLSANGFIPLPSSYREKLLATVKAAA